MVARLNSLLHLMEESFLLEKFNIIVIFIIFSETSLYNLSPHKKLRNGCNVIMPITFLVFHHYDEELKGTLKRAVCL